MRKLISHSQAGDTLVEVMLATAVLSVVLAGAFTLTNRATRLSQNATEHTEVSNLIQREAELIRAKYSRESGALWKDIDEADGLLRTGSENIGFCDGGSPPDDNAFFMNTVDLSLPNPNETPDDYLGLTRTTKVTEVDGEDEIEIIDYYPDDRYTVWVEAANYQPVEDGPVIYTDFFIYACWEGIGDSGPQSSGLVMRLAR